MSKRTRRPERIWKHVALTGTRYTIGSEQISIDANGILQLTAAKERALRQALHQNPRIVLITPATQLAAAPKSILSTSPEDRELQAQLSEVLGGNDAVIMDDRLYIAFDQEDVITRDGKVYALLCTKGEAQAALERRKTREAVEEPSRAEDPAPIAEVEAPQPAGTEKPAQDLEASPDAKEAEVVEEPPKAEGPAPAAEIPPKKTRRRVQKKA